MNYKYYTSDLLGFTVQFRAVDTKIMRKVYKIKRLFHQNMYLFSVKSRDVLLLEVFLKSLRLEAIWSISLFPSLSVGEINLLNVSYLK